jgi:hypothetical protein
MSARGCAIALLALWSASQPARAQMGDGTTGFSIGAARTLAEQTAVRFAVDLIKQINLQEVQIDRPSWLLFFTPEVNLETGAGTFSAITAKVIGTFIAFDTVVIAGGIVTPDSRFYHMVPISAGLEANRSFNSTNGIAEIGWIPWFQGLAPGILKSARAGVFLQAGYKFNRDTTSTDAGSDPAQPVDDSEELAEDGLLRIKASIRWNPTINLPESNMTLQTAADAWYDLAHGEPYYRVEGTLRVRLFQNNFLDLKWERGAGAPTFTQGDQFSANLTVLF